jgi:hypothetical protein
MSTREQAFIVTVVPRDRCSTPTAADSCEYGSRRLHEWLSNQEAAMARYRMVYGDDEQVVRETFEDVDVVREDGWTVLFRGDEAILRVRDEHVQTLEQLD